MSTTPNEPAQKKMPKLWTSLLRQPDGSWFRGDMPTTKKEANRLAQFNRIMGGISTQIVEANEQEVQNWKDENEY